MHKNKSILLLGGSAQQLVAIRAAKELGLRTVLCDYLCDNPGQHEVDSYYNVSTTDVDAVFAVAVKEQVDGILAYASDPAALPAAIVAERLGLPTNPVATVETLGVKHKFRDFLERNGFPCPRHTAFRPTDDIAEIKERLACLHYPIIVKPTDSSGSKGVTKLLDNTGLETAIACANAFSRNKTLIAEEFIERGFPDVIGGDIFVSDGKIVLYGLMACLRGDNGKGLIPIGERLPGGLSDRQMKAVQRELQHLVDALGVKAGEMNIEILLDTDDTPYFLEVGPRAGGNMIPIQLSDAFKVDLVKANVAVAMGESVNLHLTEPQGCYMHYVLHSLEGGILDDIEFDSEVEHFVYRKCMYKTKGDTVEPFDGAGKALGIVFLHFDTQQQMDCFCLRHDQLIRVKLK